MICFLFLIDNKKSAGVAAAGINNAKTEAPTSAPAPIGAPQVPTQQNAGNNGNVGLQSPDENAQNVDFQQTPANNAAVTNCKFCVMQTFFFIRNHLD